MHDAFALLRAGFGERLLITGTVQGANRLELARVRAADPVLFDAAVDLDDAAVTTDGNARAAADWARRRGFRDLLVVSSAWHLPRGLALLRRRAAGVELLAAPSVAPWPWLDLPSEWAKSVAARLGVPG